MVLLNNINTKSAFMAVGVALFAVSLASSTPANALPPVSTGFTDDNFYACIINDLNTQNISGINNRTTADTASDADIALLDSITCNDAPIVSTAGLEKALAITSLEISGAGLTDINLNLNTGLTSLILDGNELAAIDLSNNDDIATLNLSDNDLTTIDLANLIDLTSLNLSENQLTAVDISANTSLTDLNLSSNLISSIDLSKNVALAIVDLSNNKLTTIDVSKNTALTALNLLDNQICVLDTSNNTLLVGGSLQWVAGSECPTTAPAATVALTTPNTAIKQFILSNPLVVAGFGLLSAGAIAFAARRQFKK